MESKAEAMAMLREEFNRWEELLRGLSEEQLHVPLGPSVFSIKDSLAHLMAWQQLSIARLEAAKAGREPEYPDWSGGSDPDEQDVDLVNGRIFEIHKAESWPRVHQDWKDGYLRLLKLAEETPEGNLMDAKKYPWLKGYALLAILEGTYEHHQVDHLEPLLEWLRQRGLLKSAG